MKISVLVPVYGVEKYIARCAGSLFGQTYEDLEYVFVDDCTTDRSMAVLHEVTERWPRRKGQVRILRNDRNRGIGYTRQRLIDEATGDYVTFVDSDDYLPPRAIELLAAEAVRTGAKMVDGAWRSVTPGGVGEARMPYPERAEGRYLKLMLCQDIVSNRMWGRLIRRTLFTETGIRLAPGIDFSEDYSVMTRLLYFANRSTIDDTVYFYSEENTSSYTHTASPRHARSYLTACRVVLDFFTTRDFGREYLTPLQFGMTNALRNIRRTGFSPSLADELLGYRPRGILFSLLSAMLRGRCPFAVANFAYLLARKVYVLSLRS